MQKTKYNGIYKQREGILLNLDNEALQQYKLSKQKAKKMGDLETKVDRLSTDMDEIKELLRKLVK